MKKDIRIFAIPTKNASNIKFIPKGEYEEIDGKLVQTITDKYLYVEKATEFGYPSDFLYATTNEQPQIGDWFYTEFDNNLRILKFDKWVTPFPKDRKVVATNDKNLKWMESRTSRRGAIDYLLPQISPEFQQAWVKSMNENVPIVDALMDMNAFPIGTNGNVIGTDKQYPFEGLIGNFTIKYKPKINSQGYVTILPKQTKNWDDVKQIAFSKFWASKLNKECSTQEAINIFNAGCEIKNKSIPKSSVVDDILEYLVEHKYNATNPVMYAFIASKHQSILPKDVEKIYSKKELIAFLKKYESDNLYYGRDSYYKDVDIAETWIKQNL